MALFRTPCTYLRDCNAMSLTTSVCHFDSPFLLRAILFDISPLRRNRVPFVEQSIPPVTGTQAPVSPLSLAFYLTPAISRSPDSLDSSFVEIFRFAIRFTRLSFRSVCFRRSPCRVVLANPPRCFTDATQRWLWRRDRDGTLAAHIVRTTLLHRYRTI